MNLLERKTVFTIAIIYVFRMLALFMVLPVLVIEAQSLEAYSIELVGLAVGIYGLTQALLQIPLGMLSDHFGRKNVIIFGLFVFTLGGLIAANALNIYVLILGRAIQGAGAIASTSMALLSDVVRVQHRTKAMAIVGISIGFSFVFAIILGPILTGMGGLKMLFYVSVVSAVVAILLCLILLKEPQSLSSKTINLNKSTFSLYLDLLRHPQILRLNASVLIVHAVMTAVFLLIPQLLISRLALELKEHWQVYLPVLFVSVLLMAPLIRLADSRQKHNIVLSLAILVLMFSLVLLTVGGSSTYLLLFCLLIYFVGFNTLEALLPSIVSRFSNNNRGFVMGVFSGSQFLGIFIGGSFGGMIINNWQASSLFYVAIIACIVCFVCLRGLIVPESEPAE